jgi:uncharacterized protein (DUF983 family)
MLSPLPKVPPTFFDALADYPPWFVVACVTVVAAGLIWMLVKLLKWALWITLIALLVGGAVLAAALLLRS